MRGVGGSGLLDCTKEKKKSIWMNMCHYVDARFETLGPALVQMPRTANATVGQLITQTRFKEGQGTTEPLWMNQHPNLLTHPTLSS